MTTPVAKTQSKISLLLWGLVVVLFCVVVGQFIVSKFGRLTCGDFGTYQDALRAYTTGGLYYLDGNGNGIPCEDLKQREEKEAVRKQGSHTI